MPNGVFIRQLKQTCHRGHDNWYVYPDGRRRYCKTCNADSSRIRYPLDALKLRQKSINWQRDRRREVINHYGGKCACCGESQFEFLSIDHINNNGANHRREIRGRREGSIMGWLKKNNYPEGFQVLCMNCNCAKSWYGGCPHQILKLKVS